MKRKIQTLLIRLQNRNVIIAVLSGILLTLTSLGVIQVTTADHINVVVNSFLTVLVGLGVVSDPESHVKTQQ